MSIGDRARRKLASLPLAIVLLALAATPVCDAQSGMTKEEAKAAAMLELLKEQKAAQDREAIEKARRDLVRQAAANTPIEDPGPSNARFFTFLAAIGIAVFGTFAWRFHRVVRLIRAKSQLAKMNPAERKEFFAANPDL